MTPADSPQQLDVDEVGFSEDKNYALNGKIMFLVLVVLFSLFMVLIFMIPYLKKRARLSHESETSYGDSMAESNRIAYTLKRKSPI
ncbi:hypothetical protein MtrunA17_Chr3g0105671 [Medicago truncatula]|uniref:Transmembrane protein, putative n=1 Tax=Medicago truncatula TaxID=3880 RepID=A0A072UY85_MEDTR|nr:transmembrane protein, putative [Medicago truncatula]RHN67713.1 hypothetical protein MtrunA17_Chr3g0105671 [Medicago truncatula]